MKKINEMMISAYLKGMSKLNAFKDNESGEVNMVAIVQILQQFSQQYQRPRHNGFIHKRLHKQPYLLAFNSRQRRFGGF